MARRLVIPGQARDLLSFGGGAARLTITALATRHENSGTGRPSEGAIRRSYGASVHGELIAKAGFLDAHVAVEKGQLVGERPLLLVLVAERAAQQIAEVAEHGPRGGGIAPHERGDGIERIVKKMWPQLETQGV